MRNFTLTITMLVVSTVVMAFTNFKRVAVEKPLEVEEARPLALFNFSTTPSIKTSKLNLKDQNAFMEAIGFRESSGNYKAVNQYGYLGKYQFGRKTLNNLGYKNVSNREFLSDPDLQDQVMEELLVHNKKILRRYIEKYDGKTVNGIYITESGILAAAHLAGAGNVRKFFRKGLEFKDGNGTKMTSYLIKFSNYNLGI
jgi:hypothetical protein